MSLPRATAAAEGQQLFNHRLSRSNNSPMRTLSPRDPRSCSTAEREPMFLRESLRRASLRTLANNWPFSTSRFRKRVELRIRLWEACNAVSLRGITVADSATSRSLSLSFSLSFSYSLLLLDLTSTGKTMTNAFSRWLGDTLIPRARARARVSTRTCAGGYAHREHGRARGDTRKCRLTRALVTLEIELRCYRDGFLSLLYTNQFQPCGLCLDKTAR